MKSSRIAVYVIIAFLATAIAYYFLSKEPPPGWPINLVYLLTKYKF